MEKGRMSVIKSKDNSDDIEQWTLYVDDASNENGSGASMILISPEGYKIRCALCFGLQALNKEAKIRGAHHGITASEKVASLQFEIL